MERPRDAETPSLSSTAAICKLEKSHGEALSCKSQSGFFLNNEAIVTIHDQVATPERRFRNRAVEQEMNAVNNELNSELKALSGDAPKIQTALAYFLAAAKFAKRFFLIAPFYDGNVVTLQAVVATLMPANIRLEHNKAAFVQLLQVAEDREVANFLISIAAPSPGAVSAQPSSAVKLPQSAVKTEVAAAARIKLGFQHGFKDDTYTKNLLMKPKLAAVAERIKQGFEEEKYTKNPEKFNKLSNGQCPKLMVIACSDPRVCPATILRLQLGEAFIVREDAGGYPGTSAAVEYAVRELKVEHILVFGHSRCGGIKAPVTKKARSSTCIQNWIEPARASTLGSAEQTDIQCTKCEKESVDVSLSNLLAFPFVTSSKVGLHGGYYNFDDGSFEYWTHGADRKAGKLTRSMTNSRMI